MHLSVMTYIRQSSDLPYDDGHPCCNMRILRQTKRRSLPRSHRHWPQFNSLILSFYMLSMTWHQLYLTCEILK